MGISTHVLDTARGGPAFGMSLRLRRDEDGAWLDIADGTTDADGRVAPLLSDDELRPGRYELTFDTGAWFARDATTTFYPSVRVEFEVHDASQHFHVPLLVSPWGYSTYRGS